MEQLKHIIVEGWFDKLIKWSRKQKKPRVPSDVNKLSPQRIAALKSIGSVLETQESRRWLRSQSLEQLEKLKLGISNGTIDANYIKQMSKKFVAGANTAFFYRNTFDVHNKNWYKMLDGMSSIRDIADVKFSHYAVISANKKNPGYNTLISNFDNLFDNKKLKVFTNYRVDTVGKGIHSIWPSSAIGIVDKNAANRIVNELNQQLKNTGIGKKYPNVRVTIDTVTFRVKDKINPKYNKEYGEMPGNPKWFYKDESVYFIKLPIFDVFRAIE